MKNHRGGIGRSIQQQNVADSISNGYGGGGVKSPLPLKEQGMRESRCKEIVASYVRPISTRFDPNSPTDAV